MHFMLLPKRRAQRKTLSEIKLIPITGTAIPDKHLGPFKADSYY